MNFLMPYINYSSLISSLLVPFSPAGPSWLVDLYFLAVTLGDETSSGGFKGEWYFRGWSRFIFLFRSATLSNKKHNWEGEYCWWSLVFFINDYFYMFISFNLFPYVSKNERFCFFGIPSMKSVE